MSTIASVCQRLNQSLQDEFSVAAVVAAEIECYVELPDMSVAGMEAFWKPVEVALRAAQVPLLRIEKERGTHQYEIITQVCTPQRLVEALATIRATVESHVAAAGHDASFAAKPYANEPSSGLHVHLHLADGEGINAYHKTEEWMSDALRFSLGGLLAAIPASMPIFFPNIEDRARLVDADHVPRSMSWGVNNRYCALRIPMTPDPYDKRIEHRVPCANADPQAVMEAILTAVLDGLRARTEPPAQEYGKPEFSQVWP